MKLLIKSIVIAMSVTLLSCGRAKNENQLITQDVEVSAHSKEEAENFSITADSTATPNNPSDPVLQAGKPIDWDKKIIKTANVTLELQDYKSFNNTIHNTTKRYGAYIAGEQQQQSDTKIENTLSIKVPVDQFEDLMNALPAEGVKVVEKRISTEDVTGEIVDTKSRIEARKQVRDRYLDLLKQAKTMKEILEVQKEINTIQEGIEAGAGRVEYLGHQAAYSTVNLVYFQYLHGSTGTDPVAPSFFIKLKEAFKDGASIIGSLLLVIVTIWPLLLGAFLLWLLVRKHSLKSSRLVKTGVEAPDKSI